MFIYFLINMVGYSKKLLISNYLRTYLKLMNNSGQNWWTFLNCSESVTSSTAGVDSEGALRTSKSDTSLTDSFVMVNEADTKPKKINPQNVLRDGFKWQRQLVFRSKLTMHTAYDRKDNAEPASITAFAVSRLVFSVTVAEFWLLNSFTDIQITI